MFEDSLVSASAPARNAVVRITSLVSVAVQAALAATLCILPLMHPLQLTMPAPAAPLFVPVLRRQAPVKPAHVAVASSTSAATLSVPRTDLPRIATGVASAADPEPNASATAMFGPGGPPAGVLSVGAAERATPDGTGAGRAGAASSRSGPVRVSSGVSAGLLLAPIRPTYPQIAKVTRTEGTVVVRALISREGLVSEAQAISGPPLLRQAALDAVRTARYRPFQLNGEATPVEALFSIVFRLGQG